MTPEEFGDLYSAMEAELKNASSRPEAITETIVCTYLIVQFKKSAQEGIMNSFSDLSTSLAKVLATQTGNINNTTGDMLSHVMQKLDSIEQKIVALGQ